MLKHAGTQDFGVARLGSWESNIRGARRFQPAEPFVSESTADITRSAC
jgi:hypothetical protein